MTHGTLTAAEIDARWRQFRTTETRRPALRSPRLLIALTVVNCVGVIVLTALLRFVSEHWWLSTVCVYLPRSPWLMPGVLLLLWSFRYSWRLVAINGVMVVLILGPVMNLQVGGWSRSPLVPAQMRLTVVSCNVQSFRPHFDRVVEELEQIDPDVIFFQEAFERHPLLEPMFEGWNVHRNDEYLVASRLPLKFIETGFVPGYERVTVARYEVETESGPVALFNVHQTSPRRSLTQLRPWSVIMGSAIENVRQHITLRDVEALKTRAFVDQRPANQPAIIAGDFNMPNDSSLFRHHWGDFTDTFATAAVGYGYTSPCQTSKGWPANTPWAQVDHILTSSEWQIERCWIGQSDGSDHRLVAAVISLPAGEETTHKPEVTETEPPIAVKPDVSDPSD